MVAVSRPLFTGQCFLFCLNRRIKSEKPKGRPELFTRRFSSGQGWVQEPVDLLNCYLLLERDIYQKYTLMRRNRLERGRRFCGQNRMGKDIDLHSTPDACTIFSRFAGVFFLLLLEQF